MMDPKPHITMEKSREEVAYLRSKLTINGIGTLTTEYLLVLLKLAQSDASRAQKEAIFNMSRHVALIVFGTSLIGSLLALFVGEGSIGAYAYVVGFCGMFFMINFVKWYFKEVPEFADYKPKPGSLPGGLSEESREVFERLKAFVENADSTNIESSKSEAYSSKETIEDSSIARQQRTGRAPYLQDPPLNPAIWKFLIPKLLYQRTLLFTRPILSYFHISIASHPPPLYTHLFTDIDSFRILTLLPGPTGTTIHGLLDPEIHCLASPYAAISYVWGASSLKKEIVVNGVAVNITPNLYHILQSLRSETESQRLWIDAICINQSDDMEKSDQVGKMSEIYARAETVLVCLVDAEHDYSELFEYLNALPTILSSNGSELETLKEKLLSPMTPVFPPELLSQFYLLLQNEWWTRIWVLQEYVRASIDPIFRHKQNSITALKLQLGFYIFRLFFLQNPQSAINSTIELLDLGVEISSADLNKIFESREAVLQRRQTNFSFHISSLVLGTRFHNSTDPRDMIFALHGFMPEPFHTILSPDYNQSVRTVYIKTAALLLCVERFGKVWEYFPIGTNADFPSWVPDFSKRYQDEERVFGIGGRWEEEIDCFVKEGVLTIKGAVIGKIDIVYEIDEEYCERMIGYMDEISRMLAEMPVKEEEEAEVQTPGDLQQQLGMKGEEKEGELEASKNLHDAFAVLEGLVASDKFKELTSIVSKPLKGVDYPDPNLDNNQQSPAPPDSNLENGDKYPDPNSPFPPNSLTQTNPPPRGTSRRSILTTQGGIRGIGVRGVQKGDELVIWWGVNVLFVLREVDDGSGESFIVGKAKLENQADFDRIKEVDLKGEERTWRVR